MRLIISVVGRSHSGKTTLLEKLIAELKNRGYRVAIVKHSHHADDLDTPAKDTWRFTKAGSELSAINSLDHLAIYRRIDHYFDPREISDFILWDHDILLTEGFKSSPYPKIEVHRREQGDGLLTDPSQLIGVVTDEPLDVDVPRFRPDDVRGIADLIEKMLLEKREKAEVDLVVNGKSYPLDPSLKDLLVRTMLAMLPQRNGEIKDLHLAIRRKA
ncbi:MAG: molybdopterin-guanine dinucleotide biosynthesis protein B [Dehalococcoidales bacterium]|nr:molybdopterin-guanine dinucleotide biosynthesis protein B [Dehalococcoidales bacterium]